MIRVPLRRRDGFVRAWALLDDADSAIAAYRWSLMANGYASCHDAEGCAAGNKTARLLMHRAVLGVTDSSVQVDHINRNRLDNRRANLRLVEPRVQSQNQSAHRDSTSRHRGVAWDPSRRRWRAYAMVGGKHHDLGRFKTEEEAAAVAAEFRAKHVPYSEEAGEVERFLRGEERRAEVVALRGGKEAA